jgi:hypothetical protein
MVTVRVSLSHIASGQTSTSITAFNWKRLLDEVLVGLRYCPSQAYYLNISSQLVRRDGQSHQPEETDSDLRPVMPRPTQHRVECNTLRSTPNAN